MKPRTESPFWWLVEFWIEDFWIQRDLIWLLGSPYPEEGAK